MAGRADDGDVHGEVEKRWGDPTDPNAEGRDSADRGAFLLLVQTEALSREYRLRDNPIPLAPSVVALALAVPMPDLGVLDSFSRANRLIGMARGFVTCCYERDGYIPPEWCREWVDTHWREVGRAAA